MAPNCVINASVDTVKEIPAETVLNKAPTIAEPSSASQLESEDEQAILMKIMKSNKFPMISRSKSVKTPVPTNAAEADARSVYIGNVDYSVSIAELQEHFESCGMVTRVTIPTNYAKKPKGFGYIEFADLDGAKKALAKTGTLLKGRPIKVNPKRTNQPGFAATPSRPHGANRPVIVKYVYAGPPVDRSKYSKRYAPY